MKRDSFEGCCVPLLLGKDICHGDHEERDDYLLAAADETEQARSPDPAKREVSNRKRDCFVSALVPEHQTRTWTRRPQGRQGSWGSLLHRRRTQRSPRTTPSKARRTMGLRPTRPARAPYTTESNTPAGCAISGQVGQSRQGGYLSLGSTSKVPFQPLIWATWA